MRPRQDLCTARCYMDCFEDASVNNVIYFADRALEKNAFEVEE